LRDDESVQALAHEAESVELIAAFLATQDMVEFVSPTTEWVAADVDNRMGGGRMGDAVALEQLHHIPAGAQNLTAETFELIQRAHNYVVGYHGVQHTLDKLHQQGVHFEGMQALVKQFIEFCSCCQKMSRISPAIQATPFTMVMVTYWFGERYDIDTIRPLAKDDCKNEYVVKIVDAFSRFVKLQKRSCKSANRFHSDCGTQFLNDMITSIITEGFSAFQCCRRLHRNRKTRSSNV
jgi:hypothetical protein